VLTRRYGTTYYWGALLLPVGQRRHVHAVYALCRLADDIVDAPGATTPAQVGQTEAALAEFVSRFRAAVRRERAAVAEQADGAGDEPVEAVVADPDLVAGASDVADTGQADTGQRADTGRRADTGQADTGRGADTGQQADTDPTMAAIAHTVVGCGIDLECFDRFFAAMTADLTTTRYDSYDDLLGYMEGSAAVIGEMMLPVLRPTSAAARQPARALGLAFQLTNFLRDVGEDLDRGRVYLPQEDLRRFGVEISTRAVTQNWRDLMAFEIARNRELYRQSDTGVDYLPPESARCVRTARVLYSRILDRIEKADFDVFTDRIRVPSAEKAWVAARAIRRR
jgi:phytoene synthase